MFDRENEEEYATFSEKSREFLGNSVTAMDIHQTKQDYIRIGYDRGQMVLIDVTSPSKSIKTIKEHHKGIPIANLKFCDWKEVGKQEDKQEKSEEKQCWMFISIDQRGKVLINSISKALFGLKAQKHVVIDPEQYSCPIYSSISCRFKYLP